MTVITRRASLALAALAFSALPAFAADHTVTIQGFAFSPAALTVAAGDTVTFVNQDSAPHTATGGGFDTGRLNKGQSAKVTIGAAGEFAYKCNFHPSMTGVITAN